MLSSVVAAWLVSFVVPYLLDRIGSNIGWVFGGISAASVIWTYFYVPELYVGRQGLEFNARASPTLLWFTEPVT